jgi:hypothetical protein
MDNDDYHLPEDDNHHSHRHGNLKSYIMDNVEKVNNCVDIPSSQTFSSSKRQCPVYAEAQYHEEV